MVETPANITREQIAATCCYAMALGADDTDMSVIKELAISALNAGKDAIPPQAEPTQAENYESEKKVSRGDATGLRESVSAAPSFSDHINFDSDYPYHSFLRALEKVKELEKDLASVAQWNESCERECHDLRYRMAAIKKLVDLK